LRKRQFSSPLEEMDFQKDPARAAGLINRWVEERTENRIQNLIPANALDKTTTLVLVNALYLKIPWAEEFAAGATKELPFHVSGHDKAAVPTMARTGSFGYAELPGFRAVGVPFRGGQFQFLVLLPNEEGAPALPSAELLEKCASLPRQDVLLYLPKFKLEPPTISLADALKSLGVKAAFDIPRGSADFDGMAPRKPDDYLYLSDVFHKTFFALDEKGVEAAAATAVVMMRATSMPVQRDPVEVRVDRPFFFAIQHIPTSACLFLGRISDPR
ncbi:MAG: serpin family protein, partial [Verrucomicrobiota bacterium]